MAEKANADDDVSFQGETLLSLKELVLEPCAAAEGNDFELADHDYMIKRIRPSDFAKVSGCDMMTAYTIFPSTGMFPFRINSFLSLISLAICSVFMPYPEEARTYTMASSIFTVPWPWQIG